MRGLNLTEITVVLLAIAITLILAGCSNSCDPEKSYEQRQLVKTVEMYEDQPSVTQERIVVGKKCISRDYSEMNNSRFSLSIGPKEWIDKNLILGQTNYVRRVVKVYNALDEIDTIYLDKIFLYGGKEIKRSKEPMMFLVDPKATRELYVVWNTQYDPKRDVTVDFTNSTKDLGYTTTTAELCYNETKLVNKTEYKKVFTGTKQEVTGYDSYVKVKLKREC